MCEEILTKLNMRCVRFANYFGVGGSPYETLPKVLCSIVFPVQSRKVS